MMCSIPSLSHITSNPGIWPCVAGGVAVGFACAIGAVHVLPPPAFCEPKPPKPAGKIVLHYFPIPAMGEPIRLLLELSGMEWEDRVVEFKEWGAGDLKKVAKWGQMPFALMPDGTQMTQSRAMTKYFARFAEIEGVCLYPTDPLVVFRVDELIDGFEDVMNKLRKTFSVSDASEKSAQRAALFAEGGECAKLFAKMEEVCGHKFLVGETYTYGDLYFFVLINFLRCGFWQDPAPGFPVDFIDAYPKLSGVITRFGALPAVKTYYAKSTSPKYQIFQ